MESFVISVSLGTGCYRHIQISANATLFKLHQAIIAAFQFDDDHQHAFFMDNKRWSEKDMYVATKSEPSDRLTWKYTLQRAGLVKGKKFLYMFDFGDEWAFQCKVLRELEEKTEAPKLLRCVGEAPEQYPCYDDWEDWDEEDQDEEDQGEEDQDEEDQEEKTERMLPVGQILVDGEEGTPEQDELWPDFDYEGFPEIYSDSFALEEFEKLPIGLEKALEIMQYFDAAARLYGVIPLRKLLEIYNKQNEPISEELFLQVAEIIRHLYRNFSILNCDALKNHEPMESPLDWEIVHEFIYENDIEDYYDFVQAQADVPYYIPPKERFLRYADQDYFPNTDQVKQMRKFLLPFVEGENEVEELLTEMQLLIAFDFPAELTMELLEESGVEFESKKQLKRFLELFQKLNNHSRKALNRGHTPLEMNRILPIDGQISVFDQEGPALSVIQTVSGTPARNAPCPCGSGRKYKNCCGKNPMPKS